MAYFWQLALPVGAREVIGRLEAAGYEAFAVGGMVRDTVLNRPVRDLDLAVSSTPEETARVFAGERLLLTGAAHGTVTLLHEGGPLELTTYRTDGDYSDGRHPDRVTFTPDIEKDLRRRDFTVNAIAYRPSDGFCDPCGGMADLSDRLLRPVGDARTRFSEDALRILRAFRFQAQLGFAIVPEARPALTACAPGLSRVSAERVTDELSKLLLAERPDNALCLMQRLHVLPDFLPEGWLPSLNAAPGRLSLRLALLLFPLKTAEAAARLDALRFPRQVQREALLLLAHREDYPPESGAEIKRALRDLGPEEFELLCDFRASLCRADAEDFAYAKREAAQIRLIGECWKREQLAVKGGELEALGLRGPAVGAALDALLTAVIADECPNERGALLNRCQAEAPREGPASPQAGP